MYEQIIKDYKGTRVYLESVPHHVPLVIKRLIFDKGVQLINAHTKKTFWVNPKKTDIYVRNYR